MVSAFHSPVIRQPLQDVIQRQSSPASTLKQLENVKQAPTSAYDSETEDEEVKMNCIGGVQPYMTSDDEEDFDDDEVSCCSDTSRCDSLEGRVPTFVTRRIYHTAEIIRPKAMMGRIQEAHDESDTSSCCNLDEAEAEMENVSISNDDASTYADDEQSFNDDEDLDCEGREDEECNNGTEATKRTLSPPYHLFIMPSDGTPEVCEENEDSNSHFCDYEGHSIDIIDKVLALDSTVLDLPSSACDSLPSPRSKRILASLFEDDSDHLYTYDIPKKMRCSFLGQSSLPPMTVLSLGPSAESELRGTARSPFSVEETDRQLTEELTEPEWVSDTECTPVPFLSPPPSPIFMDKDRTTMCEWPSNLAVDNALTMITDLRAHSPASLMRLDEEVENRIKMHHQVIGDTGTGLTPLLKGIRVNLD